MAQMVVSIFLSTTVFPDTLNLKPSINHPEKANIVEEYILLAALLHVVVALTLDFGDYNLMDCIGFM